MGIPEQALRVRDNYERYKYYFRNDSGIPRAGMPYLAAIKAAGAHFYKGGML